MGGLLEGGVFFERGGGLNGGFTVLNVGPSNVVQMLDSTIHPINH